MYEEGMSASVETACLLEEFFEEPLVKPLEVLLKEFETEMKAPLTADLPPLEKEIFSFLKSVGYDVFPVDHFPFSAMSQQSDLKKNIIMTGVEKDDRMLMKKARMVSSLTEITGKRSVFIVKRTVRAENLEGMPIIKRKELKCLSDAEELLELIIERTETSDESGSGD
jgi:putative transcriptional regulator